MTEKAKVFIGIPLPDSVHSEFFRTFYQAQLLLPEEGAAFCEFVKWGNTVNNRNDLVKTMLKGDYTHLFFMDSDMSFPPATLSRLLQHKKDIVGGYYTTKVQPFHGTAFIEDHENGIPWRTYSPSSSDNLKQVAAIATGCMLIKRKVLESMKWPWFYYKPAPDKETFSTEDTAFCLDARERGFEVWCDFTIKCGHVGHMLVTPFVQDGEAKVMLNAI